jgi:FO synthase subunit 1
MGMNVPMSGASLSLDAGFEHLTGPPETHSRRVTSYSRNVFLPITNLCRNRCSYCGFRRDPNDGGWFMSPDRVIGLAERGKAAGCSEALLTLGERPEVHAEAKEKLKEFEYKSTVGYLEDLCKRILELGLLPHTNAGLLSKQELRRLRRYNASIGLMLECATELPVHQDSPGKNPKLRLEMIEAAGKLRIPFTTGLLIGIGEGLEDRVRSLLALRELHERYGHIQEIIIQPFEPKPSTVMWDRSRPSEPELLATVALARSIMPDMNLQVPPNLVANVRYLLLAGANDLGGISSVTLDFINPDHPWPSAAGLRAVIKRAGFVPRERLPIYPRYAKDAHFMSREVRKLVLELVDEDGYRAS